MDKEAIIKLVFGIRGCGKTVKVRNLIKDVRRLLVVDTKGYDYFDGVSFHSLIELRKFWEKVYSGDFRLIYKPSGDNAERIEDIAKICTICEEVKNLTLVIEELNELIGVAQRPARIGVNITSQAKEFYIFYNREPGDIRFFKQSLGTDAAVAICTLEQYQYLKWVYAEGAQKFEICKDELINSCQ